MDQRDGEKEVREPMRVGWGLGVHSGGLPTEVHRGTSRDIRYIRCIRCIRCIAVKRRG